MKFNIEMIRPVYRKFPAAVEKARRTLNRSLTLTEKILYAHLPEKHVPEAFTKGKDYARFHPDRVAMQDATAQMALLQFMTTGIKKVATPTTVHCDHLITARSGAAEDLEAALKSNHEVYDFLASASVKYGIGFWKPGAGIIHQVILENYAFPGGMMIGTDSHTVNAGGLGMVAAGVGGADAVDVMAGMPWELKVPELIGIRLKGRLNGWTSAKDVILKLAGILSVKGGTGHVLEYFGEGAKTISCTGKGSICNMGAEVGATASLFGYDQKMSDYLKATGREEISLEANRIADHLTGDPDVYSRPEKYFNRVVEIDLSQLEPRINGPFSPDRSWPLSEFAGAVKKNGYPSKLEVGLIGSCTNSSYEDMSRAASILRQATAKGLKMKSGFTVSPGSGQVRVTMERDGLLELFEKAGGVVLANACGPCIGQWDRKSKNKQEPNSIITSFNRNFARRNDGNPNTHAFVASPEIVTAMSLAGDLAFNPIKDPLENERGEKIFLNEPRGAELPDKGFETGDSGYIPPAKNGSSRKVLIDPRSDRLHILTPFEPWDGKDIKGLRLLIKVKGKCTTDHISMAGPWLRYRGHLDNISKNLMMGAVNQFNDKTNLVKNQLTGKYEPVPDAARAYKEAGIFSFIVGDENYGEGSSREHAAMEPRYMNVRVVLAKSFARIHETNLKKQGILALTFGQAGDYDKVLEDDRMDVLGLRDFRPAAPLKIILRHTGGWSEEINANHSYNPYQIQWFREGSALNLIRKEHS